MRQNTASDKTERLKSLRHVLIDWKIFLYLRSAIYSMMIISILTLKRNGNFNVDS